MFVSQTQSSTFVPSRAPRPFHTSASSLLLQPFSVTSNCSLPDAIKKPSGNKHDTASTSQLKLSSTQASNKANKVIKDLSRVEAVKNTKSNICFPQSLLFALPRHAVVAAATAGSSSLPYASFRLGKHSVILSPYNTLMNQKSM